MAFGLFVLGWLYEYVVRPRYRISQHNISSKWIERFVDRLKVRLPFRKHKHVPDKLLTAIAPTSEETAPCITHDHNDDMLAHQTDTSTRPGGKGTYALSCVSVCLCDSEMTDMTHALIHIINTDVCT